MANREIEFRARRAELPRGYEYGYFAIINGLNHIINETGQHLVIAGTKEQYIGLKDMRGKKIYENQTIRDGKGADGKVVWCQNVGAFLLLSEESYFSLNEGDTSRKTQLQYTEIVSDQKHIEIKNRRG